MGLFKRKNQDKYDASAEVLKRANGRRIRYVAMRDDETYGETILGKDGILAVHDDFLAVMCDGENVFRCSLEEIKIAELMSLGGVVISGICPDGTRRKVTAYYTYYRK